MKRKRILSWILVLVMSIGILLSSIITSNAITVSMADEVLVGSAYLEDNEYVLEGDLVNVYSGKPPQDADYAYFKDRVLYLNNFDLTSHIDNTVDSNTIVKCNIGIWQCIPQVGLINDFPLTICFTGKNTITDTESEYSIYTHRQSSVILVGSGSLEMNRPVAAAAGFTMNSGSVSISASAKNDTSPVISTSAFQMTGGKLFVQGVNCNGIECDGFTTSYGTLDVEVKSKDTSFNTIGLKSAGAVNFNGGSANIVSYGDAIQCSGFNVKDAVGNIKVVSTADGSKDNNYMAVNADFVSLPTNKLATIASDKSDGSNAEVLPVGTDNLDGYDYLSIKKALSVYGNISGVESNTISTVTLYKADSSVPLKTTTVTGNGSYSFNMVETGKYTVKVSADGYVSSSITVSLTEYPNSGTANFALLKASNTISGTVSGVTNSTVTTVTLYKYGSDTPLKTVTVNGNGRYSFTNVASDYYAIRAKADGYSSTYHTTPLINDDYTHNIVMESKTYFIAGLITGVDSDTVTTITLYPSGASTPIMTTTVTGENYYILEALIGAGTYTIKATASGYSKYTGNVTLASDAIVSHHIEMSKSEPITVIFTSDSKAVAGGKLEVDIEQMAELDEELMEAYLNDDIKYKWFYDGRLQVVTKNNSYEIKKGMVGHYIGVKVVYGDKSVSSDEFKIEEATTIGLLGDATEDGIINIMDATAVQKYLANLSELSETGLKLADVDGNGIVNIIDATAIQKYLAGLETGYAIGEAI